LAGLSGITLPGIRRFNFIMGFIHLIQAVLMLMISSNFSLPITSSFQVFDPSVGQLVPLHETLINISIGPIVAVFLLMSAIAHFLVSAPRINRWYANNLGKGINHARWMEYSLSSSVMIVIIAMLVGIYDIASIILIFALNATMILFGWVMEILNQKTERVNWIPYWFGVRWRDYLYGERAYIILSLVAKSALAWQVFAGTLRPV